jgi:hypothetical protein
MMCRIQSSYEKTFRIRNKKTLQNAPRDAANLRRLLDIKQRQKEEADYIEDTQRLVTEIEMLKLVLYLVSRNRRKEDEANNS